MNKINFLQDLCNKYGDFKVSTHYPDGRWSKHISVQEIWHDLDKQKWRLETATNRQILSCEVVIDLDPEKGETKKQLDIRFKNCCNKLKKEKISYRAYFTGSRGYHIHIIFHNLSKYNYYQRKKIREEFLIKYGGDLMKSSDKSTIALEYAEHWKTGNKKRLVDIYE